MKDKKHEYEWFDRLHLNDGRVVLFIEALDELLKVEHHKKVIYIRREQVVSHYPNNNPAYGGKKVSVPR